MTKLRWIALGGVIAGLILLVVSCFLIGFDFSKLATESLTAKTYTPEGEFSKISIETNTGDITVLPATDGKCSVVCYQQENLTYSVKVENDTLTVQKEDNRKWYQHIGVVTYAPSVTVYLPESSYESLQIQTATGDVRTDHAITFQNAKVKASTADINWESQVVGKLDIALSTGDITVFDVNCTELKAVASTGDVRLDNTVASGLMSVEVSTGDVTFEKADAGEIRVTTSTGDVKGTLLTEKVFITRTSTGDINVPETTEGGKCRIETNTGDITITIE